MGRGSRGKKKPETEDDMRAMLKEQLDRWNEIYRYGCQDPFWEDGVNLNLVRNHIIYYYKKLEELQSEPVQLSLFNDVVIGKKDRPVPPKVPMNYMAPEGRYPDRLLGRRRGTR